MSPARSACSDDEQRAMRRPSFSRKALQETHLFRVAVVSQATAATPHCQGWRPRLAI